MHFTELIYLYFLKLRLTKAQSRIHWNSKWLHRYLQYAVINCEVYLSPTVGDNLADLEDRGSQAFVPRNRSWKEFSLTHTHPEAPPSHFHAQFCGFWNAENVGYAALLAAGTYQHFPWHWRWRESMDLAPFHNTGVPTPCRAQPARHHRVQIRHALLCNASAFPLYSLASYFPFQMQID